MNPKKQKAPPTDTMSYPLAPYNQSVNQNTNLQQQQNQPPAQGSNQFSYFSSPANASSDNSSNVTSAVSKAFFNSNNAKSAPTDTFSKPFPNGYYQVDFPIKLPSAYPDLLAGQNNNLTYTAVNCGFTDFADRHPINRKPYSLKTPSAKLMIVVTMYNEDCDLFSLTMEAVYDNIKFLLDKSKQEMEDISLSGKDPSERLNPEAGHKPLNWQDIVVCIVCDGRGKCPYNVKVALEMMGLYQSNENIMTDFQNDPVQAHVFEYSSSVHVVAEVKKKSFHLSESKYPVQYVLCMKENNKKKIDSHGWAFNGFCPLLNPDVVVLLDMGTKPSVESFYHFWKHFDGDRSIGGVCGEIIVDIKGSWFLRRWINFWKQPMLAAQNFEYKMSNILDKSLQSVCGYITVLPGAFSAYRYDALKGQPLIEYFKAEGGKDKELPSKLSVATYLNISSANKYLAEDRILCFEIFCKKNERWYLRYIKEAKATTDAPETLGAFLNQRRRWLNGSMFAFFSGYFSMFQVFQSKHSFGRKLLFLTEMNYLMLDTLMTLIGPMNFYAVFILTLMNVHKYINLPTFGVYILGFVYIIMFIFGIVIFVGNAPQGSQGIYTGLSRIWMLIMIGIMVGMGYSSYLLFQFNDPVKVVLFVLSILLTYGLYFLASVLFRDTAHLISSMPGYYLLLPSYINIMLPFAMSNIHDVTWGTRPQEPEKLSGKLLPKNKMEDGLAEMHSTKANGDIEIDVNNLQSLIKPPGEDERPKKKRVVVSKEDQDKNVRFSILFLFFFVNLLGSAAITYGASYGAADPQSPENSFNGFVINYMVALFVSIAFFALVRFIGCLIFIIKTPVYH
ncbi:Chitin synthase, class 1 [Lobulomyces angularis]|nr:Chitin synthase, class 1 [Lobulomyces angularis]